jgi:hypothetical protein
MTTASVTATTPLTAQAIVQSVEQPKAESTEEEIIANKIKEVFGKDAEIAIKIATCESGLKQFDDKGQVVTGTITPDKGLFQISLPHHSKKLKELGLDPDKLDDNVKYAKYLFDKSQTDSWRASKKCWSK